MIRLNSFCFYFFLPSLLCDNLLCYYSPLLHPGDKPFEPIITECHPDEWCFVAVAHYGEHRGLSERGCMAEEDCSLTDSINIKGIVYNMSYDCCDWAYCNSCQGLPTKPLLLAAALLVVAVRAGS